MNKSAERDAGTVVLIVGAIVAAGLAINSYANGCGRCTLRWRWTRKCVECGMAHVCGDCSVGVAAETYQGHELAKAGHCCKACLPARNAKVAELRKLEQDAERVELVSKNYKGKVDGQRQGQRLQTGERFDGDDAKRELKRMAVKAGASVVVDVEVIEAGSYRLPNGRYKTLWQASGLV